MLRSVSNVLETYYFGSHSPEVNKDDLIDTPVLTMIGVPGAVKSWVIGRIRTWIDIRLKENDVPHFSSESKVLSLHEVKDPVTGNVQESIKLIPEETFGKSTAFAFSGAAACIIKCYTLYHGFSFPINLNKQVEDRELLIPELIEKARTKLMVCWSSVKLIIIDEAYKLKVEWLSLIYEKLRQIFNSQFSFAGIPVLLSADAGQIVPVNGKPLFTIRKYFHFVDGDYELNKSGAVCLSQREERVFQLYINSKFKLSLLTSVQLLTSEFFSLNTKIATYNLSQLDTDVIASFFQPSELLKPPPWIDFPWLFPTRKEVNEHIRFVTERAAETKDIFRAWAPVEVHDSSSLKNCEEAIRAFYSSSTYVTATYSSPLPYIDFFPGQIACLKKKLEPNMELIQQCKGICD